MNRSTANQQLLQRSRAAVWHPCTQMKHHETQPLLPIVRGEGAWLFDADGHRLLDAVSSWWVNLFGHNQPHIKAALRDQLERIEHVMLAGLTHEPVIELSERLAALTGLGHAFYASDGASAIEIALKMSAHAWRNHGRPGKNGFASLAHGYHGETVGALGVTDIPLFRSAYAPLLRPSAVLPSPDARAAAAGVDAAAHAEQCAQALEAWLDANHADTAALIVEPLVQCAAGMAMYDPHYLRRARALCDRYGLHLIADEIATGFGRTGKMFAMEWAGVSPDLMCLSKGLTGGTLPLAATLATEQIYQAFYADHAAGKAFLHSHSYTGNALACAAALATLEIFGQQDWMAENRNHGHLLWMSVAGLLKHPNVAEVRQQGMILAIELAADARARKPFPAAERRGRRVYEYGLEKGVLLRPLGDVIYFMPPYILTGEEVKLMSQTAIEGIERAVQ
jgi:adenosylmethionine-8-amino-7-oxononanoate aminotransferase